MKTDDKPKSVVISGRKLELASETAGKLVEVIDREVPQNLVDALVKLFTSMQSKTLERFQGLLAGVPRE